MASAPVLQAKPRVAEFGRSSGGRYRGVWARQSLTRRRIYLGPSAVSVNNLAPSNVEKKAQELRDMLDPQYFGWLGLVVKRISTQANFHSICLSLTISVNMGKVS
jgi:hypothetical protein